MAVRLLLVEFFPGALRRNEKSMLFPFLQGLARACGGEARWLCFDARLAPAGEGYGGRMLRAELDDAQLASLGRHAEAFRPTHVATSELLGERAAALLAGLPCPPDVLVMPTASDLAFGTYAAAWLARVLARFSADPARPDHLARCGGFLAWWGVRDEALAARHLVEIEPDYSAVLADEAAARAQPLLTIVSGTICGSRLRVADNPLFAGVDLGGLADHRGCSFCMSPAVPSYSPAGLDPLPLWEAQLRKAGETAGGRNRGVYEFFDYRAWRRIDEVAELVVRLGLPPSLLLFNPRVDEVVNARRRMERALPLLAGAGHRVRIVSMGVENFSEAENARLNKGIGVADVDELLALAREWERAWPGTFVPFKAGGEQVELGLLLFTPWTTLADVRTNLECARARGFSRTGYWLYSTLYIQEMEPMYRLARAAGDVLAERFPDRAQVYGVYLNESEVGRLVPWRFRDPAVADYYALLVRACAAEREGAGCAFFRGDEEFPAVAALWREALARDGQLAPLDLAFALLALFEAPGPRAPRLELLREALLRAAPGRPARPEPVVPAPAAPPPAVEGPRAPAAPARSERADKLGFLLEAITRRQAAQLPGLVLAGVGDGAEPRSVRVALQVEGRPLELALHPRDSAGGAWFASEVFRVVHAGDSPGLSRAGLDTVRRLVRLLDAAVKAYAPELGAARPAGAAGEGTR